MLTLVGISANLLRLATAIVEAKLLGLVPYCVTIDKKGHAYLPYLFGSNGFSIVSNASELPRVLPKIYLHLTAVH